jgi:hypothetical protein
MQWRSQHAARGDAAFILVLGRCSKIFARMAPTRLHGNTNPDNWWRGVIVLKRR